LEERSIDGKIILKWIMK